MRAACSSLITAEALITEEALIAEEAPFAEDLAAGAGRDPSADGPCACDGTAAGRREAPALAVDVEPAESGSAGTASA